MSLPKSEQSQSFSYNAVVSYCHEALWEVLVGNELNCLTDRRIVRACVASWGGHVSNPC